MKILHLVSSVGYYGAEVMLISLALQQMEDGDCPIVCGLIKDENGTEPKVVHEARKRGIKTVTLIMKGGIFHQGRQIMDYANSEGVEIVHSHGYRPSILVGMQNKKKSQVFIRTLHGSTYTRYLSKMFLYYLIDSLFLWRHDGVVTVSEEMKNFPLVWIVPKSVVYISNGIAPMQSDSLRPHAFRDEKLMQLRQNYFLIGSIGRLSTEKAQADLIRAIAKLRSSNESVALVLIGEGYERGRLEALAEELGVAKYVYMPGYLDNATYYLELFDLFCLSSVTEGLPMTILEAMRQEVPILSTDVGQIPVLLDESRGYLVPARDVAALTRAICEIIHSYKTFKEAAVEARRYFEENYSSRIMTDKYRSFYCSLMPVADI